MNDWLRLVFIAYLLLGSWLIADYGISMDEPIQRKHGMVAFEYIRDLSGLFPDVPKQTGAHLPTYDHRDYGMLFQTLAYGLELALGIDNSRDVFRLRHLMVFVLFWAACMVFYRILYRRFGSVALAMAGVLMLILSPRIFGDSMYNPKDIPLLCWFVFAFYTHIRFADRRDRYGPVLHGLACALAIGSRVVGVVWPLISLGYLSLQVLVRRDEKEYLFAFLKRTASYLIFLLLFTFLLWPVLWEDPVGSFLHSFNSMKRFRWYGEMLYMGEMVRSTDLPWHYIPVWIAVTTPLSFLVLMALGIIGMVHRNLKGKWQWLKNRTAGIDLVAMGALAIPLGAVIVLGSVLYNGWRHLYFVYPFLVYAGVWGMHLFWVWYRKKKQLRSVRLLLAGLLLLLAVDLVHILYIMVRYHPHQSVYFNALAGDVERNFERDYYGVSYRQGLMRLLENYPERELRIYSRDFIGKINTMNFPKIEAQRLVFVDRIEEAEFFVTLFNFRSGQEYREFIRGEFPFDQPVEFSIRVKGYRVFTVQRIEAGK
ncbi:hypothetical protein [Cyclobacterium xiamenense]|uniref:hypothetical protein n=1 Tax=Cyclobacterium xiamenense TaxID=1297121 RepID=UPI0035D1163D